MALTITEYLKGRFAYPFKDENLLSVVEDRDIAGDTIHTSVSTQNKELLIADLYMILAGVAGGGGTIKRGDTTVVDGSYNYSIKDRKRFLQQANMTYAKYGETTIDTGSTQFVNMYPQ